MTILVNKNQLVIPGEVLARGTGVKAAGGVYRKKVNGETEIIASMIGLAKIRKNDVGVVPLEGCLCSNSPHQWSPLTLHQFIFRTFGLGAYLRHSPSFSCFSI